MEQGRQLKSEHTKTTMRFRTVRRKATARSSGWMIADSGESKEEGWMDWILHFLRRHLSVSGVCIVWCGGMEKAE